MKGKVGSSTRIVANKLCRSNPNINISRETVQRTAHQIGLKPHKPRKVAQLTEQQKTRRVSFGEKYLTLDWNMVWFSDEKKFSTQPSVNPKNDIIWDYPGFNNEVERQKSAPSANFWGTISSRGICPLILCEENLKAPKYTELLE